MKKPINIEGFRNALREKLRTYFKSQEATDFTAEMLSYLLFVQATMRGLTVEDAREALVRMAVGLSGAVYDMPFFTATAPRVMPMFQAALLGYLDAAKYLHELDSNKDMSPDARMRKTELASSLSRQAREFAVMVLSAERGVNAVMTFGKGIREVVDDMFKLE